MSLVVVELRRWIQKCKCAAGSELFDACLGARDCFCMNSKIDGLELFYCFYFLARSPIASRLSSSVNVAGGASTLYPIP